MYDGTRWIPDIGGLKTMELAKSLADSLVRYALTITDERRRKDYLEYSANGRAGIIAILISVMLRVCIRLLCRNLTVTFIT